MLNKKIVKAMTCSFAAVILASTFVSACGSPNRGGNDVSEAGQTDDASALSGQDQNAEVQKENSQSTAQDQDAAGDGNILIAYFTAGENSDVDAVSSASAVTVNGEAKGRLRALADMIKEYTGGDLFSIETAVDYPGDGSELIDYAAKEQEENARPELISHIENVDQYDTIFVGFPNWWYDMPMAMYSFFDEYDFSGKTIIPFNSHNGSRFSDTIATIQELEKDAEVITDGFTVNERDVADADGDISDWLGRLGYETHE